ncbi:MAG: tripartite tricarboxylate transporter TctB family protein [Lautropia sp.]
MKLHDSVIGVLLLAVAAFALWQVRGFPPVPGQPYGAALFPGLAAGALAVCALVLIVKGLRGTRSAMIPAGGASGVGAMRVPPLLATVGAIGFYILAADWLGFVVTGSIILAVLMAAYGVPWRRLVPVALVATLLIHTGFYRLLKVPLPWGVLQPIAW